MIDLDRYKRKDGNEATTAEGLVDKENLLKAYEIANKDRSIELIAPSKPSYYDGLLQGAMEMAEWKDKQIAKIIERLNGNIEMTNHLKEELKNENE